MRYAIVSNARSADHVGAYLPAGYAVIGSAPDSRTGALLVIIAGEDVAGWTMDDYVIPRLASGLIWARELEYGAAMEIAEGTE